MNSPNPLQHNTDLRKSTSFEFSPSQMAILSNYTDTLRLAKKQLFSSLRKVDVEIKITSALRVPQPFHR